MGSAELAQLARDLRREARVEPETRKVLTKGAENIRTMWKRLYHATEVYFRATSYPASITKDVRSYGIWLDAEIGPDKGRRQGPLGNLIEFGSKNNNAQKEGEMSLAHHGPAFVRSMEEVADIDI